MADKKRKSGRTGAKQATSAQAAAKAGEESAAQPQQPAAAESTAGNGSDRPDASSERSSLRAGEHQALSSKQDNKAGADASEEGGLKKQRTSLILKAVLDEPPPPVVSASGRKLRYPWYADVALAAGLLVAVAGFTMGLFRLYIAHKAQQCIMETDFGAAITLLKGSPVPPVFNLTGNNADDDPGELLARALYLDAMHKLDENDVKGGLAELEQIRPGSHYFDEAQRLLADHFTPSSTQLTGGIVHNDRANTNK